MDAEPLAALIRAFTPANLPINPENSSDTPPNTLLFISLEQFAHNLPALRLLTHEIPV
jgi:hypothetical protein